MMHSIFLLCISIVIMLPTLGASDVMKGVPPSRDSQVTLANYRAHPFNEWSFRNVGGPLNVLMIPRGGNIHKYDIDNTTNFDDFQVLDTNNKEAGLLQVLQDNYADGYIVIKDNKILYERYFNGLTRNQQHIWFSMTKSLATTALGILVEQGKIDLNASPADYIPELKNSGFSRVTIQNVLNHSSAIDFKENYTDPNSDFLKYYAKALNMAYMPGGRDASPSNTEIYGIHDFLVKFVNQDKSLKPGEAFDYNSSNADVIGWLISRISGETLQRFIQKNIWQHLGTEHDAYIAVDRAYQAVATAGMNTTLRDAARFGQLMLNRGKLGDKKIIPEKWIDESLNINSKDINKMHSNPKYKNEPWQAYKNMWWVLDADKGEYAAVGIHGQVIYINRSADVVISFFSSQPKASAADNQPFRVKLSATRKIARHLRGK